MDDRLDPCCVPGCSRVAWGAYPTCYAHTPVSRESLYRVWATISTAPHLTVRECAERTGYSYGHTMQALKQLEHIGAIRHEARVARSRQIIEPFCWVEWP